MATRSKQIICWSVIVCPQNKSPRVHWKIPVSSLTSFKTPCDLASDVTAHSRQPWINTRMSCWLFQVKNAQLHCLRSPLIRHEAQKSSHFKSTSNNSGTSLREDDCSRLTRQFQLNCKSLASSKVLPCYSVLDSGSNGWLFCNHKLHIPGALSPGNTILPVLSHKYLR